MSRKSFEERFSGFDATAARAAADSERGAENTEASALNKPIEDVKEGDVSSLKSKKVVYGAARTSLLQAQEKAVAEKIGEQEKEPDNEKEDESEKLILTPDDKVDSPDVDSEASDSIRSSSERQQLRAEYQRRKEIYHSLLEQSAATSKKQRTPEQETKLEEAKTAYMEVKRGRATAVREAAKAHQESKSNTESTSALRSLEWVDARIKSTILVQAARERFEANKKGVERLEASKTSVWRSLKEGIQNKISRNTVAATAVVGALGVLALPRKAVAAGAGKAAEAVGANGAAVSSSVMTMLSAAALGAWLGRGTGGLVGRHFERKAGDELSQEKQRGVAAIDFTNLNNLDELEDALTNRYTTVAKAEDRTVKLKRYGTIAGAAAGLALTYDDVSGTLENEATEDAFRNKQSDLSDLSTFENSRYVGPENVTAPVSEIDTMPEQTAPAMAEAPQLDTNPEQPTEPTVTHDNPAIPDTPKVDEATETPSQSENYNPEPVPNYPPTANAVDTIPHLSAAPMSEATTLPDAPVEAAAETVTHTVAKGENFWDLMEGDKAPEHQPQIMQEVPEKHKQELIDLLRDKINIDAQFREAVGFKGDTAAELWSGDELNISLLDEAAREIAGNIGWIEGETTEVASVETAAPETSVRPVERLADVETNQEAQAAPTESLRPQARPEHLGVQTDQMPDVTPQSESIGAITPEALAQQPFVTEIQNTLYTSPEMVPQPLVNAQLTELSQWAAEQPSAPSQTELAEHLQAIAERDIAWSIMFQPDGDVAESAYNGWFTERSDILPLMERQLQIPYLQMETSDFHENFLDSFVRITPEVSGHESMTVGEILEAYLENRQVVLQDGVYSIQPK